MPIPCVAKKTSNQIIDEKYVKAKQKSWTRRVNWNAGYYFLFLLVFSILNAVYTIQEINEGEKYKEPKNSTIIEEFKNSTLDIINEFKNSTFEEFKNSTLDIDEFKNSTIEEDLREDEEDADKSIDYKIFKWALPSTFGQFFFCHVQLMIIVGLCLDGGHSVFARFFNTKPLQASLT